jgi:hypothetical protein
MSLTHVSRNSLPFASIIIVDEIQSYHRPWFILDLGIVRNTYNEVSN